MIVLNVVTFIVFSIAKYSTSNAQSFSRNACLYEALGSIANMINYGKCNYFWCSRIEFFYWCEYYNKRWLPLGFIFVDGDQCHIQPQCVRGEHHELLSIDSNSHTDKMKAFLSTTKLTRNKAVFTTQLVAWYSDQKYRSPWSFSLYQSRTWLLSRYGLSISWWSWNSCAKSKKELTTDSCITYIYSTLSLEVPFSTTCRVIPWHIPTICNSSPEISPAFVSNHQTDFLRGLKRWQPIAIASPGVCIQCLGCPRKLRFKWVWKVRSVSSFLSFVQHRQECFIQFHLVLLLERYRDVQNQAVSFRLQCSIHGNSLGLIAISTPLASSQFFTILPCQELSFWLPIF